MAKARKFAHEEIRPISLARDRIADAPATFDWDIIRKGSRLGLRTAVVAKQWGGHGIDFVIQALVIAELAKADSAIAKTFSQCWKWSHLIAEFCSEDQKQRFLKPFVAHDTYLLGHAGTDTPGLRVGRCSTSDQQPPYQSAARAAHDRGSRRARLRIDQLVMDCLRLQARQPRLSGPGTTM
jgi:alkylation response protein AidB-like acyl-CoA dehydrogenase